MGTRQQEPGLVLIGLRINRPVELINWSVPLKNKSANPGMPGPADFLG